MVGQRAGAQGGDREPNPKRMSDLWETSPWPPSIYYRGAMKKSERRPSHITSPRHFALRPLLTPTHLGRGDALGLEGAHVPPVEGRRDGGRRHREVRCLLHGPLACRVGGL